MSAVMVIRLLILSLALSLASTVEDCSYQLTCNACIEASARCFWCADGEFDASANPEGRCSSSDQHCPDKKLLINVKSYIDGGQVTETIKLNLRNDEEFEFEVKVKPQPRLPFQLYILLDGSRSMLKAFESVKEDSKSIAVAVKNKWKGSKVGLGIFNDKEAIPFVFVNLTKERLVDNIPQTELPFWDLVSSIVDDSFNFNRSIDDVQIGFLNDKDKDPEAHLDVIGQVLACKSNLGFTERSNTRHVVFLTTDSPYWVAGDGRYGGIINPPTSECRGASTDEQSAASIMYDYPSVGFLKTQLQQKRVYLVASVTNDVYEDEVSFIRSYAKINDKVYRALENAMFGLAEYAPNHFNSDPKLKGVVDDLDPLNVNVVMDKLEQISRRVSLVPSGDTDKFIITATIDPGNCPKGSVERKDASGTIVACDSVPEDSEVTIRISVKVKDGVELTSADNPKFYLNLPGVHPAEDLYTVEVKHLARECTNCGPIDSITKSKGLDMCDKGALTCGVCKCNEGFHGTDCDCSDEPETSGNFPGACLGKVETKFACNGNGGCFCGECECGENAFGNPFAGKTCGCDRDTCPKSNRGEVCWGRGSCFCSEDTSSMRCKCDDSKTWNTSSDCRCKNVEVCSDPDFPTKELCNGRAPGCTCGGICECQWGFSGTFCEKCEGPCCMSAICNEARYQQLAKFYLGVGGNEASQYQERFTRMFFAAVELSTEDNQWKKCSFRFEDKENGGNCRIEFYVNREDLFQIAVDAILCKKRESALSACSLVAASVLTLGFILIAAWKIYVKIEEKKDAEKYELYQRNQEKQAILNATPVDMQC